MRIARALAITGVLLVGAFATGEAAAHPLGNFSVNHLTQVRSRATASRRCTSWTRPRSRRSRSAASRRREVLARKRAEVERGLRLEVDGRAVALRPAGAGAHRVPRRAGRPEGDARRGPARRARRAIRGASCCATRPSRAGRDGRRSWQRPATAPPCAPRRLPATPPNGLRSYPEDTLSSPLDQRTRDVRGAARRRHAGGAARSRRRRDHHDQPRQRRPRRRVQRRRLRPGRAAPAAARGVRLGRAARAVARARQGDGGRLPDRHARHRAARGRPRRDGHDHPHDRRLRARARDAAAVPVHPARGPVPVADPGVGAAGRGGRDRCAALARAVGARARRTHEHDAPSRTRPRSRARSRPSPPRPAGPRHVEGPDRDGRRGRA